MWESYASVRLGWLDRSDTYRKPSEDTGGHMGNDLTPHLSPRERTKAGNALVMPVVLRMSFAAVIV